MDSKNDSCSPTARRIETTTTIEVAVERKKELDEHVNSDTSIEKQEINKVVEDNDEVEEINSKDAVNGDDDDDNDVVEGVEGDKDMSNGERAIILKEEGVNEGEGDGVSGAESSDAKEGKGLKMIESPYERAMAAVAAAAAAHSAQQHKSPSEEAALAKETVGKNSSLLAQQQKAAEQQSAEKECVVNAATYAMLRSAVREQELRIAEYNESLLLLMLVLAKPNYARSLASLKLTGSSTCNAIAANPQQPHSEPSETAAKELLEAASLFHAHMEATHSLLSDRLPTPPQHNTDGLVLDLLPPCFSKDDATNAFFDACSKKTTANALSPQPPLNTNAVHTAIAPTPSPSYASATSIASVLSSKLGRIRPSSIAAQANHSTSNTAPDNSTQSPDTKSSHDEDDDQTEGQDYSIQISREMLGLTVENVLERTIVRTVLPNGAAKKAGAKVGSLIVQVGTVDTKFLTHFETIDELRQSQRPLKLVLRRISRNALAGAREEMGRLIRGGGYGCIWNQIEEIQSKLKNHDITQPDLAVLLTYLKHLWKRHKPPSHSSETTDVKKEQALVRAGEKLIWILLLLCYGFEREAISPTCTKSSKDSTSTADAAKSVSKILADYIIRVIFSSSTMNSANNSHDHATTTPRKYHHPRISKNFKNVSSQQNNRILKQQQMSESPLFQIGDILHRTQTFLADPFSPAAALLRGEVIALLCDVLDIDTDMELAEIETTTTHSTSTPINKQRGEKGSGDGGPITDLGSSGSLLKLIIRNCTVMQSQICYDQKENHWKHAGNRFLAVVHRLAASRSTSARVTACSLAPVLWSHLDFPHQLQLRGVITRALHDVEVIVRKSTAAVLHEIAELVFDSRAVPWLVLMCERAMTDPDPQLRAAAMTLTWHLAEHLPNAFLGDASKGSRSLSRLPSRSDPTFAEVYLLQCKLLPVATRLGEDRAPSVRLAVAAQCDRLCTALGEHWFIVIIDLLQALLADSDDRVRSEATLCMPRLVESVVLGTNYQESEEGKIGVLEALLPIAIKLLKDSSTFVRVSLATACGELLTFLVALGRGTSTESNDQHDFDHYKRHKKHVDETLIPLVQRLLHDPDPEVTSAALRAVTNASRGNTKKISSRRPHNHHAEDSDNSAYLSDEDSVEMAEPVFLPVLSEKQVLRLLPTLSDLATSPQWRVRQSAVEIVPALLGCTELLESRTKIAKLCITLMNDSVDAVRKTAAECLCLGGSSLASGSLSSSSSPSDSMSSFSCGKNEWISSIVLPHLTETCHSTNCKQRILCLKMVEVILCNHSTTSSSLLRQLLDISLSLSQDPIANVRLNVGRVLAHVMHTLDHGNVLYTRERLEHILVQEKDRSNCDRDVLYFVQKAISKSNSHL